ncbi:MAG: GAF domain-containing protein [Candidatus Omnitrophica bacterium]|nr:GAF domain-containing protein [Candidatus Omnitrophota bacterium]
MNPLALSGLLISLTSFSLATVIWFRAPRSRRNALMVCFNVCCGVWGLGTLLVALSQTPRETLWSWRLIHVGGISLGMGLYYQSLALLEVLKGIAIVSVYLFAGVFVLACVAGVSLLGIQGTVGGLHDARVNFLFGVFLLIWIGIVIAGHRRLFVVYRTAQGERRRRLRFIFYAMAAGFLIGTLVLLLPLCGVHLHPYGNFFIPLYLLVVTYVIVRHRPVDLRIVVTRAGLLLGTYLIVLGVPFVIGWWGRTWLEARAGRDWWLVPLGLCTALATAGPFAYAFLRRQAEARLLKEQRHYQRTLQLAARGMTMVRSIAKLAKLITRLVSRTVRVTHASLLLWDRSHERYVLRASHGPKRLSLASRYTLGTADPFIQWLKTHRRVITTEDAAHLPEPFVSQALEQLGAALVVPGMIEEHLVGLLALGPKVSGAVFSSDDLNAFATLANEAAMAVENAMSYEELLKVNEQLKAASERLLLQERLAAAGQFAAGMAHEIKNPLSAIKTFTQYLPEKYADPAFRKKFFRIVQSEIDRINTIVKELSDFAKPAPLQLQPVQVTGLVDETLSLLSNQCLEQRVDVHNTSKKNGLVIQADPQQLKQVLLNLFLNSLEAMPDGGRLEVTTELANRYLTLRISDTGCGIAPEDLRHVWDPFFTTKERGMGLGLAIVKGVVERHGGSISLCSDPRQGTTVSLALPLTP